ncbi:Uncharacterised protein [uncultured archaeon]|nr:Uncharacterised protein [uncultured archaeon]
MKRGLGSLLILGTLGFSGCTSDVYNSTYLGHAVEFHQQKKEKDNANYLYIYSKEKNGGNILFEDDNQDGRFDQITLNYIKKGDEVEQYASLEMGQRIVNSITNKK